MSVEYELEHDPWEGRLLDGRFRIRERTATNGMIRSCVGEHVELERSVTIKRLVVGDRRGRTVEETRTRFLPESAAYVCFPRRWNGLRWREGRGHTWAAYSGSDATSSE